MDSVDIKYSFSQRTVNKKKTKKASIIYNCNLPRYFLFQDLKQTLEQGLSQLLNQILGIHSLLVLGQWKTE